MAECTHDCSSCGSACAQREQPQDLHKEPHRLSTIGKVIGVVSGKGGVGKSMVTGLLACQMRRMGHSVGIMDADITGPSVPKMFGLHGHVNGSQEGLYPMITKTDIKVMSINLLTEKETDPVIWRGPILGGVVEQFWTDVIWHDVDYLFVDMPPGTGDVPLTVFQTIPLDGILIVTSPQELVSLIVTKAVNMARMMQVPILGLVENYSYFKCPDCGKEVSIFGESSAPQVAMENGIPLLARLPIDPALAAACDKGEIEDVQVDYVEAAARALEALE